MVLVFPTNYVISNFPPLESPPVCTFHSTHSSFWGGLGGFGRGLSFLFPHFSSFVQKKKKKIFHPFSFKPINPPFFSPSPFSFFSFFSFFFLFLSFSFSQKKPFPLPPTSRPPPFFPSFLELPHFCLPTLPLIFFFHFF